MLETLEQALQRATDPALRSEIEARIVLARRYAPTK